MAETEKKEEIVESEEHESEEIDEEEEESEDESPSIEDEFRSLFGEADSEARRLKGLAMKAEQSGDPASAAVLREVAGGVVQLIQDVIATCGGAFRDMESAVGDAMDEGSHLETEDAEKLHGLLLACRKVASEVLNASAATSEGKQSLETLIKLIDDQLGFVLEISDYEPATSTAN